MSKTSDLRELLFALSFPFKNDEGAFIQIFIYQHVQMCSRLSIRHSFLRIFLFSIFCMHEQNLIFFEKKIKINKDF